LLLAAGQQRRIGVALVLERVEQLTGRSIDTIEGRVDLFLALRSAQAAIVEPIAE
jgi:hypothetical protein